jgi:release factor glutamine methyltransferase
VQYNRAGVPLQHSLTRPARLRGAISPWTKAPISLTVFLFSMDIRAALQQAMDELGRAGVPSHQLAAELLLMHALGCDRAWIYGHPEHEIPPDVAPHFLRLVSRRAAGTPTQYLTGKQEFWGLEFCVAPGVLIPRPETEHLVEVALERLKPKRSPVKSDLTLRRERIGRPLRLVDVGTGSGCLAVALSREVPEARLWATDVSREALAIAWRNAARHDLETRIEFLEGDLLTPFLLGGPAQDAPPFDLIISNPPYVSRANLERLPREVREHEPEVALFAGETGLELYRPLIRQAEKVLAPGGAVVLELGDGLAGMVRALLGEYWKDLEIRPDLAGIPRVLSATRV